MTESRHDIVSRLKDYFGRQIVSLKGIRESVAALCENPESEDLARVEAEHADRVKETRALAAEFTSLEREWRASEEFGPSGEAEVRGMASEAEALAMEVQALYEKASEQTKARAEDLDEALNEVRRGKNLLTKYSGPPSRDAWYLDRKA